MAALHRIRKVTRWLDSRWTIPGTHWRFGLDPLVGLLPAAGAVITAAAGVYLLLESRRVGAPWTLITRMVGNLLIDAILGEVPVAGDAFDVAFKAHVRNLKLLERWLEQESHPANEGQSSA